MPPENSPETSTIYQILAGAGLLNAGSSYAYPAPSSSDHLPPSLVQPPSFCSSSSYYAPMFDLAGGLSENNADNSPEDRTIAALRNHKEAEKRRRARINSHLDKLRSLLPCNSKTDKASLLAMVVNRVKELKQQTSDMVSLDMLPSETDEITVLSCDYADDGKLIFKATLCCEDRSDLLSDINEILKSLHLKTLRAEMATLGGRIRNILIVSADKDQSIESVHFLQNSLKSLLERSNSGERLKRRRMMHDRKIVI